MSAPVIPALEIAFSTDPLAGTPSWTDVTSRLRGGQIRAAGRNRELDRAEAGSATFLLDNIDRAIEPGYADATYAPNILPGKRIRYKLTGPARVARHPFNRIYANYLWNTGLLGGTNWWSASSSGAEAVTLTQTYSDPWTDTSKLLSGESFNQATVTTTGANRTVQVRHDTGVTFLGSVFAATDGMCPCREGDSIRAHVMAKFSTAASAAVSIVLQIAWYDRNGNYLSLTQVASQASPTTGTWYQLKGNGAAPANARYAAMYVSFVTGTTTGSYVMRYSACNLAPAANVGEYGAEFYGPSNPWYGSSPGDYAAPITIALPSGVTQESYIGAPYVHNGVNPKYNGDTARRTNWDGDARDPDGSLMCYPTTYNWSPNPGFQSNVGSWTATGATLTRETDAANVLFGVSSAKIVTANAASGEGIESALVPLTSAGGPINTGTQYAGSMWLKGSGTVRVYLRDTVSGKRYSTAVTLTGTWQRVFVYATCTAASTGLYLGVETNSQQAATFYVAGNQINISYHIPPYVATTQDPRYSGGLYPVRVAAAPLLPSDYLDETQGWAAFYIRPTTLSSEASGFTSLLNLIKRSAASDVNKFLRLSYASNTFFLQRYNGSGVGSYATSDTITWTDRDTKILVIAAWTSAKLRLSVNGGAFAETNNTNIPAFAAVGDPWELFAYLTDADVFWIMTGTGTLTDADADALYDRRENPDPGVLAAASSWTSFIPFDGDATPIEAAGNTEVLYDGLIDKINVRWDKPYDSQIELACTDGFRIIAQADVTADLSSDASGDQIDTLATQAGWPEKRRQIPAGYGTVTALTIGADQSAKILSRMQDCADAEPGYVFISQDGDLVFHDRYTRSYPPFDQVLGIFGDADLAFVELPYRDPVPSFDDTLVYNEAKVIRDGGTTAQRIYDAASATKYGRRSYPAGGGPKTVVVTTDQAAENLASYAVYRFHEALMRIDSFTIVPLDEYRLWAQVMGRSFGDRIEVVRRPPGGGTEIRMPGHIESILHSFTGTMQEWKTEIAVSPAVETSFWIAEDAVYGRAEITTRAGF